MTFALAQSLPTSCESINNPTQSTPNYQENNDAMIRKANLDLFLCLLGRY